MDRQSIRSSRWSELSGELLTTHTKALRWPMHLNSVIYRHSKVAVSSDEIYRDRRLQIFSSVLLPGVYPSVLFAFTGQHGRRGVQPHNEPITGLGWIDHIVYLKYRARV